MSLCEEPVCAVTVLRQADGLYGPEVQYQGKTARDALGNVSKGLGGEEEGRVGNNSRLDALLKTSVARPS